MDNDNKCVFNTKRNYCSAIRIKDCDGLNTKCKFYKTKKQFDEENDRAIDICRDKGLCEKCYRKLSPCNKSCE